MKKLRDFLLHVMLAVGTLLPQGTGIGSANVQARSAEPEMAIKTQAPAIAFNEAAAPQQQPAEDKFSLWLKAARKEAIGKGISAETVNKALPDGMRPIARVIELDRKQPEKTRTYEEYLDLVINNTRINNGKNRIETHAALLDSVSSVYGVEKEVIVALWGLETNFGGNTGGFDVIHALATLAYDGRRSEYFRSEMFKAIRIVDEGHISLEKMKGSWAGAMGQCQFMPSSFYSMAQDFDRDGHKDIWTNHSDIFASAANYLSKSGWKKNQPWGESVTVPVNFDRSLLGRNTVRTIKEWQAAGITPKNSGKSFAMPANAKASVIQPDGPGTKAFIIYDNYRVFLKWNNSNYFASSVGILSNSLKPR